jgi:flagellar protein FliO/FliZ
MPKRDHRIAAFALFAACIQPAMAAAPVPGAGSAVVAGSVVQVILGLAVVLALVAATAWLLKRFSSMGTASSGIIRVIGGAAVGQRERIVLVEVAGTWLLVGVAPGQVRMLHTMPRTESAIANDAAAPAAPAAGAGFATWLRRVTERRNHG